MLITLYKIGRVHFPLLGANGFYVKAKNETDLLLRARVVVRTSTIGSLRKHDVDGSENVI